MKHCNCDGPGMRDPVSDPDHCVECCREASQEDEAKLDALKAEKKELIDVLCALMVLPDGYCANCSEEQQRDGHTGECREAREVLRKHGLEVGTYPRPQEPCLRGSDGWCRTCVPSHNADSSFA